MAIFVGYPWLAAAEGLVLVALGWWVHRRMVVGVGVIWIVHAAYETAMQQRSSDYPPRLNNTICHLF